MTPPQLLTPAQLAETRARVPILRRLKEHSVITASDTVMLPQNLEWAAKTIEAFFDHIDALSQANAEQAGEIERLKADFARLQGKIHDLCPDAKDGFCCGGMLQDDKGHALGACEWRGHIVGGHT